MAYTFTDSIGIWKVKGGDIHRVDLNNKHSSCGSGGTKTDKKRQNQVADVIAQMENDIEFMTEVENTDIAIILALEEYVNLLKKANG